MILKRLYLILLVLIGFLTICQPAIAGDTGTYKILEYDLTLTPFSDGTVSIDYHQKWQVESGSIPWITVGLPNNNFEITAYSQAVRSIQPANEGGWSGVRIDLDQDYQPEQSFEVSFSIKQSQLFYADEDNFKMDFTPGWYDRAFIDRLTIKVRFFADIATVVTDPEPARTEGEIMSWEWTDLGKGQRVSISIAFPKNSMNISEDNLGSGGMGVGAVILVIFLIIIGVIVLIAIFASLSDSDGYSGGGIFYGGYGGGSSGSGGISSGGGGGFGGRASSCACACVACACACACAGGGGAGCSRKLQHSCPKCSKTKKKPRSRWWLFFFGLLVTLLFIGCVDTAEPAYDSNASLPEGEPDFPALTTSWVIDQVGVLSDETIHRSHATLNQLKADGVAEVVVLIINGVQEPETYATHYGRWLKLGEAGLSMEGGNNGVVWLIRPDADEKLTISVGRGLPSFTTQKYGEIVSAAIEYLNFANYNRGVQVIVDETDRILRELYSENQGEETP